MYTFTMVGCTLFKFCYFKCAKACLLEILGMSRLWHDLMAHGHVVTFLKLVPNCVTCTYLSKITSYSTLSLITPVVFIQSG